MRLYHANDTFDYSKSVFFGKTILKLIYYTTIRFPFQITIDILYIIYLSIIGQVLHHDFEGKLFTVLSYDFVRG